MRTMLALLLIAVGALLAPSRRCRSVEWLSYDCPDEFGTGEWRCVLRAGHSGDHQGRWDCAEGWSA